MARCGHARPRAPRRAGGRLPRGPRRARPARRRSCPGPAARRLGSWSATPRPPRSRSADCSRPSMRGRPRTCRPRTRVPWARCEPGSRPPSDPTPSCRSPPRSSEPRATTPRRGPRPSRPVARSCGGASRAATGRSRTTSRSTASAWLAPGSWPDWRPSRTRRGGDACSWDSSRCGGGSTATVARSPGETWPIGHRPTRRCSGNRALAGQPATPPSPPTSGRSGWPMATSSGGPWPPSRRGGTR